MSFFLSFACCGHQSPLKPYSHGLRLVQEDANKQQLIDEFRFENGAGHKSEIDIGIGSSRKAYERERRTNATFLAIAKGTDGYKSLAKQIRSKNKWTL